MISLAPNYPKFRVLVSYSITQTLITIPLNEIFITLAYLYFGLIPHNLTCNPKSNIGNYSDIAKQNHSKYMNKMHK